MAWGMRNLKISIFGSSIMEGRIGVDHASGRYYSILQQKLSERFPEVCFSMNNGAVGGWSTRELMQHVEEFVLDSSPDYCLVMFGANNNDLSNPERVLREGELEQLMEEFQKRLPGTCQRVGVVLNPVINERHWVRNHPAWAESIRIYGGLNEMLELEREKARGFYRKYNYPVVDLAKLMSENPCRYVCEDGIHLTPEGHRLFAEVLFETMETLVIRNGHDTNGR